MSQSGSRARPGDAAGRLPVPIDTDSKPISAAANELLVALMCRAVAGVALTGVICLATDAWPRDRIESIVLAWLCACADHPLRCAVASMLVIVAVGPRFKTTASAARLGEPLEES